MNALPVVHRELLVGARRPGTYWARVGIGGAAIAVGFLFLLVQDQANPAVPISGTFLFSLLSWWGLIGVGVCGIFFAADAISEERREGTLGLLFLTRLKCSDIIASKLASNLVRSGFALLSALPVLALPLLMGGVTFAAYGKAALTLVHTLLWSVSIALLTSSVNRESGRALVGALFVVLTVAGVPLLFDRLIATLGGAPFQPVFSFLSPVYAMVLATGMASPGSFALCLAVQNAFVWATLFAASRKSARLEEPVHPITRSKRESGQVVDRGRGRHPLRRRRAAAAMRLRTTRPIEWLVHRKGGAPSRVALLGLSICAVVLIAGSILGSSFTFAPMVTANATGALLQFVLFVWIVVVAARETGEGRRDGSLELLLATPLTAAAIASGWWRGLVRVFGPALVMTAVITLMGSIIQALQFSTAMGAAAGQGGFFIQLAIGMVFGLVGIFTTAAAVAWVGLWFGLTGQKTSAAALKTFLLACVLPGFLLTFVQMFSMLFLGLIGNSQTVWIGSIVHGSLAVGVDLVFVLWARKCLLTRMRAAAAGVVKDTAPVPFWRPWRRSTVQP